MDLLKIIKRFRSEKDPELQKYEGKCLSTFSKEDLVEVAGRLKLPLDDVLVLLSEDDTRENLCKIVSFAQEQNAEEEGEVNEEPSKKKRKVDNLKKKQDAPNSGVSVVKFE